MRKFYGASCEVRSHFSFVFVILQDLVSSKHRAEMCKLALQSSDWIKTSTWEVEQDCWTETAKVRCVTFSMSLSKTLNACHICFTIKTCHTQLLTGVYTQR